MIRFRLFSEALKSVELPVPAPVFAAAEFCFYSQVYELEFDLKYFQYPVPYVVPLMVKVMRGGREPLPSGFIEEMTSRNLFENGVLSLFTVTALQPEFLNWPGPTWQYRPA